MKYTDNLKLGLYEPIDSMNITGPTNSLNHNMQLIDEAVKNFNEIIEAREDINGNTYSSLKERLDTESRKQTNQNAFSTIKVSGKSWQTNITANAEQDILSISAGSNIDFYVDEAQKQLTISSPYEKSLVFDGSCDRSSGITAPEGLKELLSSASKILIQVGTSTEITQQYELQRVNNLTEEYSVFGVMLPYYEEGHYWEIGYASMYRSVTVKLVKDTGNKIGGGDILIYRNAIVDTVDGISSVKSSDNQLILKRIYLL